MVIWSAMRRFLSSPSLSNVSKTALQRNMSGGHHRTLPFAPSRFQWNKFKDLCHYYMMLGIIPATGLIFFTNVFVGPATLSELPENHVPKYWEYYRHPITRFIARYIMTSPQQEYEKYLHYIYEANEKARLREIETKVKLLMSERNDYQAYYYRPVLAKYHRMTKDSSDHIKFLQGD